MRSTAPSHSRADAGDRVGIPAGVRRSARAGAVALLLGAGLLGPVAVAQAAGPVALKETGSLKRVGKAKGFNLGEQGAASGSIKGSIHLSLKVVSTDKVTASVSVYPKGGALYGSGSASYHVHGGYALFSGTLSIKGGSGGWKGAHASNLKFTGRIQRSNDNVTVSLSGKLYK
ncbi:MAG: hypothetical protein ACYCUM_11490 [Solirubrobacteraceae bacterium]